MHPDSSAFTNQESQEFTTVQPPTTTDQHGLHFRADPAVRASSADTADDVRAAVARISAVTESQLEQHTSTRPPRGLSPRSTPSPPPLVGRDRVTEYEQASTPPVRKRTGPRFEVIQKYRSPGDKRSPIQELPNEVLTHAFAHLAPADLASVALVSKRFHELVTGPHAWRSAFAHFFPGAASTKLRFLDDDSDSEDAIVSGRRAFTRLTALASWRSEYVVRTRLLRSLARGKPVQSIASPSSARSGQSHTAVPTIKYYSQLFTTINHLHTTFGTGLNKRLPRCVHAADDQGGATSSDPNSGKVDHWGLSDPQSFLQFVERFPGDAQYGLGPGEVVGVPNVMDVSQPYGMIHGEGSPGGMVYFRSTEEMRGRFLLTSSGISVPEDGIPKITSARESISTVWIAKSSSIPLLTDGAIGLLTGTSLGVLSAYSLGLTNDGSPRDQRFNRGQMTARWTLSPGVPLVAIAIDNDYTINRYAQNRIWAVVLNALGEVFYLTKFPKRPQIERNSRMDEEETESIAWVTGRSVYWNIVEPSRRKARPDPYGDSAINGTYSPRTSWAGMCLSKDQIKAEIREIESFSTRQPKEFQKVCLGWDMQRKLDVDFAGNDDNNAGENVVVFDCGLGEGSTAAVTRYTRCRFQDHLSGEVASTPPLTSASTGRSESPPIEGSMVSPVTTPSQGFSFDGLHRSLSEDGFSGSLTPRPMTEEWRTSSFALGDLRNVQILATAMDNSLFASQTISEDPLLSFSGRSTNSSPISTPMSSEERHSGPEDVPGQRARLFAVGTQTGAVILWNIRASIPAMSQLGSAIEAVRVIYTSSPQISCLAISSLYVVHGGNDGLVQAWDPLASDAQPIRTLHSRFRSRARRRLIQAQASPQGVGINLFAAGAICLDPDPTVLRGIVSLGTQLLYWSFSSSVADSYKSQKRRLRHTERGSNHAGERFSAATRSHLKDYIASERYEMDREKEQKKKESYHFANRFGTTLMDGSEEEMLAYAAMLSQESLEQETQRRASDTSTATSSAIHSSTMTVAATPLGSASPHQSTPKTEDEFDAEVAEAIRLSLASSPSTNAFDVPIRRAKPRPGKSSSVTPSPQVSPSIQGASQASEMSDLDFALQLSLAEEQSRQDAATVNEQTDEFPVLPSFEGSKGKGKHRAT